MSVFNQDNQSGVYFDLKYKIMVIGESKVGKTSLIKRYTKDEFGGVYLTTVGVDFQDKIIDIENKKVRLQVWDTAGQERFRNITKKYFQSTNGLLVVYDITDKESFKKIGLWLDSIKNYAPENAKYILVGNKCDLDNDRKVSFEEGEDYAKKINIKFFESSAKEGTNVKELFFYLANEIYQDDKAKGKDNKDNVIKFESGNKKGKKKCC